MKNEYEFRHGKRGAVLNTPPGKTRITIRIDDDILQAFRAQVHAAGGGSYQSLINRALREHVESREESLKETLRSVVREELAKYGKNQGTSSTRHPGGSAKSARR
jgi:hypothetical protein